MTLLDAWGPGNSRASSGGETRVLRATYGPNRIYVEMVVRSLHLYHYIPDVAAGLSILGCAEADAYGRPWMLPCPPAESMRELVAMFSRKLG